MWIKKLLIEEDFGGKKEYTFNQKNLIVSSGTNTQGKTTLMRFIVWALGFEVDLTSSFSEQNLLQTKILISNSDTQFVINRRGDAVSKLNVVDEAVELDALNNDEFVKIGNVSDKDMSIYETVYGITNYPAVLKQILGLHYIDQDQGWSVYNSGIVVKKYSDKRTGIRIDFKSLIASIEGHEQEYQKAERDIHSLKAKKVKYEALLTSINANFAEDGSDIELDDSIRGEIDALKVKLSYVESRISELQDAMVDWDAIRQLIKGYKLRVKVGNEIVNVTDENLVFDKTNLNVFKDQIAQLNILKKGITTRLQSLSSFVDENNTVDTTFARISKIISSSIISDKNILQESERIEADLKAKREIIKKYYDIQDVLKEIAGYISGISEKLNLKSVSADKIFTKQLSESGAVRNLRVLSYRLGMLKWVESQLGIELPVFIDSPVNNEMDEINLQVIGNLLNQSFEGRQIIVATNKLTAVDPQYLTWQEGYKKILLDNGVLGTLEGENEAKL